VRAYSDSRNATEGVPYRRISTPRRGVGTFGDQE
jgi:hypothetical protein